MGENERRPNCTFIMVMREWRGDLQKMGFDEGWAGEDYEEYRVILTWSPHFLFLAFPFPQSSPPFACSSAHMEVLF